jgi:hypothetical protein
LFFSGAGREETRITNPRFQITKNRNNLPSCP